MDGLDSIRWDDCDPVLISNHCYSVDAVSFKLELSLCYHD